MHASPERSVAGATAFAFGERAQRDAMGLRADAGTTVIVCDGNVAPDALACARDLRAAGRGFYAALLLPDSWAEISRDAAACILENTACHDLRREMFEGLARRELQLNQAIVGTIDILPRALIADMRTIAELSAAALFRSQTERYRIENVLGGTARTTEIFALADRTVPMNGRRRGTRKIIVWGPHQDARDLAIYAYAFWYLREPVTFVCRGALPNTPHRYIDEAHGAQALIDAALIVDTDLYNPGTALAFADRGFGIACAHTSGAHEYLDGAVSYQPGDYFSILDAASRARADHAVTVAHHEPLACLRGEVIPV